MHIHSRLLLSLLLARREHANEREQAFREDLDRFPKNGWSLHGLATALEAQGMNEEAEAVRAELEKAWSTADVPLARILHQSTTATTHEHALTGFRSVGVLDIASTMPARSSVAKASHNALLNRLATRTGAICGLANPAGA